MVVLSPVASNTAVPVSSSDGSTQSPSAACSRCAMNTGAVDRGGRRILQISSAMRRSHRRLGTGGNGTVRRRLFPDCASFRRFPWAYRSPTPLRFAYEQTELFLRNPSSPRPSCANSADYRLIRGVAARACRRAGRIAVRSTLRAWPAPTTTRVRPGHGGPSRAERASSPTPSTPSPRTPSPPPRASGPTTVARAPSPRRSAHC